MAETDLPSKVVGRIGRVQQPAGSRPAKVVGSAELFGEATEIGIDHAGTVYRLRITRQGKLILTK